MYTRKTILVWIGIIVLSGMFLMGQETWPPEIEPDCIGDYLVTDDPEVVAENKYYNHVDLSELSECNAISGSLHIEGTNLTNLQALKTLEFVGGNLQVGPMNMSLPTCEADWLWNNIGNKNIRGTVTIQDNNGNEENCPPIDAPDKEWTWVDFSKAKCANGSSTGIGVSLNSHSPNVHLYLQGGGGCWDEGSCKNTKPSPAGLVWATHLNGYDEVTFRLEPFLTILFPDSSIFHRGDENPVEEWNYVYVPYCTGDFFAGNTITEYGTDADGIPGTEDDVIQVHHVGYNNIGEYLKRLVPTFKNAERVLITGTSSGGYGSVFNFDRIQKAFANPEVPVNARVDQISDGGAFFIAEHPDDFACIKPAQQDAMKNSWGLLDENYPHPEGFKEEYPNLYFHDLRRFLLDKYSKAPYTGDQTRWFGLICAKYDLILRRFFGDLDLIPDPAFVISEEKMKEGLFYLTGENSPYAQFSNWKAFILGVGGRMDEGHGFFIFPRQLDHVYTYDREQDNVKVMLNDWIDKMLYAPESWKTILPPE